MSLIFCYNECQLHDNRMPMNDNIIIFEDDAICVIDKPYGVIVNNAESVKSETIQTWFD